MTRRSPGAASVGWPSANEISLSTADDGPGTRRSSLRRTVQGPLTPGTMTVGRAIGSPPHARSPERTEVACSAQPANGTKHNPIVEYDAFPAEPHNRRPSHLQGGAITVGHPIYNPQGTPRT